MLNYPLSRIINLSVKLSVFPEECKTAKPKPVFKEKLLNRSQKLETYFTSASSVQNDSVTNNYKLQDCLKENDLLCKYHWDFR